MKNAMSINDLEKKFGSVEFEGAKYILIQDAYLSNEGGYGDAAYFANAIKVGDTPDDGYVSLYTVEWTSSIKRQRMKRMPVTGIPRPTSEMTVQRLISKTAISSDLIHRGRWGGQ